MAIDDAVDALSEALLKPIREVGTLLAGELDKLGERVHAMELELERQCDRIIQLERGGE